MKYKSLLMTATAGLSILAAGLAEAKAFQNEPRTDDDGSEVSLDREWVSDGFRIAATNPGVLNNAIAPVVAAPAVAVPAPVPAPAPIGRYYLATGGRTDTLETALTSWRNDAQFLVDGSKRLLGLEHAYARGLTGQGIRIGINDEGVDTGHAILTGAQGVNSSAVAGYGNNGRVNARRPHASHGIHVAGTAAGARVTGERMFGAAYGSQILSATVNFSHGDLRWGFDVARGLSVNTGYENIINLSNARARVINNSWGSDSGVAYTTANAIPSWGVDFANLATTVKANDSLVVFAAGNSNGTHAGREASAPLHYAGLMSHWLSVVNVTALDTLHATSSRCGRTAAWCVSGPGSDIISSNNNVTSRFFRPAGNTDRTVAYYSDTLTADQLRLATTNIRALAGLTRQEYVNAIQSYAVVGLNDALRRYNINRDGSELAALIAALTGNGGQNAAAARAILVNDIMSSYAPVALLDQDLGLTAIGQAITNSIGRYSITEADAVFVAVQARIDQLRRTYIDYDLDYAANTGTSMAAPSVSGFAALLMENFPLYDTPLIADIITSSGNRGADGLVDRQYGWGVLQMDVALNGPRALRGTRNVNVATGDVDTWTHNIVNANTLYVADIQRQHADHIGGLNKYGGGELILTGTSTFTENSTVYEGLLTVNGELTASDVSVAHRGILGGTGRLADVNVLTNGVLAPGSSANPYGTLTVNGNLDLDEGSYLWIRARGDKATASNSRVQVRGTTNIDGAKLILRANNGEWTGQKYGLLVLASEGALTGAFNEKVDTDLAFLDATVNQAEGNVRINLARNNVSIASVATRPATQALAGVLDVLTNRPATVGEAPAAFTAHQTWVTALNTHLAGNAAAAAPAVGGNGAAVRSGGLSDADIARSAAASLKTFALTGALLDSSAVAAAAALPLMTGEVHATAAGVTSANASHLRDATLDRGRTRPSSAETVQPLNGKGVTAWALGQYGTSDFDGNDDFYAYRSEVHGFSAGIDKAFDGGLFGVAVGQNKADLKINPLNSNGDIEDRQIGVYGALNRGGFGLRAGASWITGDVSTRRQVVLNRLNETIIGDYEGDGWQAYVEASVAFGSQAASIEPYISYAHYEFQADVEERGGSSALGGQIDNKSELLSGGVRFQADLTKLANLPRLSLVGNLGYTEDLASDGVTYRARLAEGAAFDVNGVRPNDGAIKAELGVSIRATERVNIGFGYTGLHSDDYQDNRGYARVSLTF